jgi:hypothetical protein
MQAIVCGCGCDKRTRYCESYRCLNRILEILILLSHTTTLSVVKGEENVMRRAHPTTPFPRCWKKLAGMTDSSTAKLRLEAAMTAILTSLTREGGTCSESGVNGEGNVDSGLLKPKLWQDMTDI